MAPFDSYSILEKCLLVVACALPVYVSTPMAMAQHLGGHTAGGVVHTAAPPIPHVPVSAVPIARPPMIYSPVAAPRISMASSAGLGTTTYRPPWHPIHPFPPVLVVYESRFPGGPLWGLNRCWWATCDTFWPWMLGFTSVSSPGPANYVSQVYETPIYIYGEERADLPQLFLKDGTILNVTDYWLVNDQLHFTMVEMDGTKPAEHVISFDALDLKTTVDVNTRRGFRFMLRNEPFEQYLRDHPEDSPSVIMPPHE